jgi:hypothetical protein
MSVVSPTSEINDTRTCAQFKTFSFSRFKKTLVCDKIIENMQKKKIEPACYWAAELICAGHYADLWQIILEYMGKHIHLGNPKIAKYVEMRYTAFRNIVNQGHYVSELHLRNNSTIRKIFAEIIVVLTLSNKKHSFELIRINRVEEFEIETMKNRLIAPSTTFVESLFRKNDPKEMVIPINEFAYNISQEKHNMLNACYWLEWTIDFDALCRKRKQPLFCERRKESTNVENKFQCDVIWIVWEALVNQSHINENPFIESLVQSLLVLFSIKYTTSSCKKHRYLIYFAISLLTEPVPTNIELITDKSMIEIVVNKIDEVYEQIKENEESPNTEYLFANLEKQVDLEKSIRKIEIMNSMNVLPTVQN